MAWAVIKGMAIAGAAVSLAGFSIAHSAGKPPAIPDPRKALHAVAFFDQSVLVAQGLTPNAAVTRLRRFAHYRISTVHYVPRGFQLAIVKVYPYLPGTQEPQDTQTFIRLVQRTGEKAGSTKAPPAAYFELDHQYGQPYSYHDPYKTAGATLGGRKVVVAEQNYRDFRTQRTIDLINVYWYDRNTRVASEVTADLATAHLSRAQILSIAASVQ